MSNRSYLAVSVLGFLALVVSMAAFSVRETDLAIKYRFGEIVRAEYAPGLHFMVPLVNNVRKFDKRILTEDYPAEQFLTSEEFWHVLSGSTNWLCPCAYRLCPHCLSDGCVYLGIIPGKGIRQVVDGMRL